jgi:hypothetical protein
VKDKDILDKVRPIAPTRTEEMAELFVHYLSNKIILDMSNEDIKNFTDYVPKGPEDLFNKLISYIPNPNIYMESALEEFSRKVKPV